MIIHDPVKGTEGYVEYVVEVGPELNEVVAAASCANCTQLSALLYPPVGRRVRRPTARRISTMAV